MSTRILLVFSCLVAGGADWVEHPENVWVKQSPTDKHAAPMIGWEGSGAFDPFSKKWIHFAGHDGIPQGFHLFTYDLQTRVWEQRFPNTSPPGACCVDGSSTFDEANRRFVAFPGGSLGHGYQWSRGVKLKRSAVWLYDVAGNAWTNMRPPPYNKPLTRAENIGGLDAGATYDPRSEVSICFGGQGSQGGTNNLHFYDAYANQLTRISAANAPSPRDGMGLCVDTVNNCLVVFGSQYASDEKTYLYRFATGTWESHDLQPRPNAKKGKTYSTIPRMAFDPLNELCLCLIWDDATGTHETWTLDVAALKWQKMSPAQEPEKSMSRSRNLSFSPHHNAFILDLNPSALKGKGVQVWTYRIGQGKSKPLTIPPAQVHAVTGKDRVHLTWSQVPEATGYAVSRADAAEPWTLKWERIGVVRQASFEDLKVTPGKNYFYTVRSLVGEVESAMSMRARAQPRVMPAPVVSVLSADKVEIAWSKHGADDVVGYNVYRGVVSVRTTKKGEPKPWRDNDPEYAEPMMVEVNDITGIQKLNEQPLSATSLVDAADLTKPGPEAKDYKYAVFAYIVRAVNKLGVESGPSPYALTIPSEPTHVLSREKGKTAELKWQANPEKGIAGYHVYKLQGTWNIVRVTSEPIRATAFTQESGQTRYWIVAVDALGQEGQPSSPVWHQHSYKGFFQGEWHQ